MEGTIDHHENLNIRKFGWHVICKNEVQQKAIVSDFENIPSNSSAFKELRPIEIKDCKECIDEFQGDDAFVSNDELKLKYETQ